MSDTNSPEIDKPVALVVGGNGAIGKVIVARLAQQGFVVVVASRSAISPGAEADPGIAASLAMDVTDPDQIAASFAQLRDQFGRLDLLVNSASPVIKSRPLLRMSADDWDQQQAVHGRGAFLTAQQAAKIMRKQRQGKIINIASVVAAAPGSPGISAYAAAKAAMVNLSKSLNQELNQVGIQSTAICPTYVDTPFWEEHGMDASQMLKPEDVAETVCFLWNLPQHVRIESITLEAPVARAK